MDARLASTLRSGDIPADVEIPENYVSYTLKINKPLPPMQLKNLLFEIRWLSASIIVLTPLIGAIGAYYSTLRWQTAVWSIAYYYLTGLGITAGYHRLWSHRAYNAALPLQIFLAVLGAGAVEGSIHWWARGHRAHHRYTDTELDPYNAHNGFWYCHLGWMMLKPRRKPGVVDVTDLWKSSVIRWQHNLYIPLLLLMGFGLPTFVAGHFWNDWQGGFVYAGVVRLCVVHHSTFCINSLAHWLGEANFDDKHTPRDHLFTAFITIGEGYHNYHHQYPMDYRTAIRWWQYDPTKWFIWSMKQIGLASHLKTFPDNEVKKGQLTMKLKKLRQRQEDLDWPSDGSDLPVISWESYQDQAAERPLILIGGFIHDLGPWMEDHPGGDQLLRRFIGKDATTAFSGGIHDHSNGAHNLLSMKRVGVLHGGYQHILNIKESDRESFVPVKDSKFNENISVPPGQRLKIVRYSRPKPGSSLGSEGSGSGDE